MGSVMSNIECPNCNSPECFEDYYYKTGEEYKHCPDCGYSFTAHIKNRTKKMSELTDDDWEVKELKNPFCAFVVMYNTLGGTSGSIETEENFIQTKEDILKNNENIKSFSISRFVNGKIEKQLIFEAKGLKQEIKNEN